MVKNLFIKTFGCQMNTYDSDKMVSILKSMEYSLVSEAKDADLVILNTCHIREKASEKLYSDLGRLKKIQDLKAKSGKDMLVAVGGCVGQAHGEEIIERAPNVSIVFGPQSYHNLPDLIDHASKNNKKSIDVGFPIHDKFQSFKDMRDKTSVSEFLTIQEGCDKFCTFCVVPYTRGAEFSRPLDQVVAEAKNLVKRGAKEIVLLGQNVNAYHGLGPNNKDIDFAYLISSVAEIEGLERVRFTTSHPIDMSKELIKLFGSLSKLMPMLHLPVQSGSDKILKLMNRKHTSDQYIKIIDFLRECCPDIAFSSDFIVGYPGETEQDFESTIKLVEKVEFSQSYSFKFSARTGTPAAVLSEQVEESIKTRRLIILQELLREQHLNYNKNFIGKVLDILFEKKQGNTKLLSGRSQYLQLVHTDVDDVDYRLDEGKLIGSISKVLINKAGPHNLHGRLINFNTFNLNPN